MVQCLQDKNVSCQVFQELVKNLDALFPNMTDGTKEELFLAFHSFLKNHTADSACSQTGNSSTWLLQNFGRFMRFASFSHLSELNANFKPLEALNLLTLPQIANFTLELDAAINSSAINIILGTIRNSNDMSDFLGYFNKGASLANITGLSPILLNRTFEVIKSNTSFTTTDWNQLIKDKLTVVLPEITLEQLTLVPQNISCDAYHVIIESLDSSLTHMAPGKPENVYTSFIKPYMTTSGSVCAQNSSSSFLQQNFGKFSQFADYSDFVAFNKNFSALEVLHVLTLQQVASFSLELSASSDPTTVDNIVGTLHNTADLYDFLKYINNGLSLKNTSSLNSALSQALLNKTFETVKANISAFTKSDWTQLLQGNLGAMIPEISSNQLSLIPKNISCDSYQTILGILDLNFPKMNSGNQQDIYKSLIKPYLSNKGSDCSKNLSSSAILKQNLGKFSQFANYKDLEALNISGGEILSSLTMQQVVDFSLDTTINSTVAAGIVGMIQNVSDVNTFLDSLNTAGSLNNVSSLSPYLSQALLTKTFQMLKQNLNSFNNSDWAQLFQNKLSLVLPEIGNDQLSLIPTNISCTSYQTIFHSLQSSFSKMDSKNREDAYKSFIKPYLKKKGNAITCYNGSDPNASWLVDNLGSYMIYTSEEDLILFANESMLRTFANDHSCVELVTRLELPKDTAIYFTSLLTSSASFNLSSLPDVFLCFLTPSALVNLTAADTLEITKKINQQCYHSTGGQSPAPTPEDVQVAISLVSRLDNFSADTLMNLGQSAVGLSMGQIDKISDGNLKSSLPSLSNVTGWSVGQARSIMEKLLNANYQIDDLRSLGSLVTGLPSKKLQELNPTAVLNAVNDAQFASKLASAPPALQNTFVMKIISANSTTSSVVKHVPANLASFIPKSFLLFKSEKPSLVDVNGKSWSPDQASMFFDDITNNTSDYSLLSSSVLQGFTCSTPAKISNSQVKLLGKAMKTNNASLSEDQLNCLSRQITKGGYTADLDSYPGEVFLFLNSANYSSIGNCTEFFTKVGKANINVLSSDTKLRSALLTKALSCMKISGPSLTENDITVLGHLTCEMNASYIAGSPPAVLTQLSQCKSFSAEQQTAIQTLLGKDNSVVGTPSTWTKDTLHSLGGISGFLTKDMLTNISGVSFKAWMKEAIQASTLTKNQFAAIVTNLLSTRARRAAGCASGKEITASNVNDALLPLSYTPTELDACLGNDTLTNYLSMLSSKTFTDAQLSVLKNKLDALYPTGFPESVLRNLGEISRVCGDADVSKWNITSVDTLSSLLSVYPSETLAQSEIGKYLSSGNQLTAAALNVISSRYVCLLSSAQVQSMSSSAITDAKALDLSACSQAVKDAFYAQAKSAFQSENSQVSTYFNLVKPYLGGSSAADLKTLAERNPNMDIGTFVKLNPSAVMSLSVSNVKSLLGTNVEDLKTRATNSVISNWIANQKQSDLDTLGLGITGGIRDYVTTKPPAASASTFTHGLSILLGIFGAFLIF
ncbi:otoancorin-like [Ranitomeya imitator]|uniref:otoancorin-like n=1 Tax=Ranitomeya imitator TaxID=111125 RepID=UPI0037E936E5